MAKLKLTIADPKCLTKNDDVLSSIPDDLIVDPKIAADKSFKLQLLQVNDDDFNFNISEMDFNLDLHVEAEFLRECITFVGSCNGLVCLYYKSRDFFTNPSLFICNPAMHKYHEISVSPSIYRSVWDRYWFGYVPSIDDYKIVVPSTRCDYIYLFSLRTGKWNRVWDTHHLLHAKKSYLTLRDMPVYDNFVYWSYLFVGYESENQCIVGLDLVNEQFKAFPWMDWLIQYGQVHFFLMNGCLSLFCISSLRDIYDVWTMKQGDDWNSWEKLFSFPFGGLSLQCITPAGKFLALASKSERGFCQFKIVDPSQGVVEQLLIKLLDGIRSSPRAYVESLISPFGMIKSKEEENHKV